MRSEGPAYCASNVWKAGDRSMTLAVGQYDAETEGDFRRKSAGRALWETVFCVQFADAAD